jgi:hypothetical protein
MTFPFVTAKSDSRKGTLMKTIIPLLVCVQLCSVHAAELLVNKEFEEGDLSGWYTNLHSDADNISIEFNDEGNNAVFNLSNGGTEPWHVLLMQKIAVQAGYKYSISFGGYGIEGNRTVERGLCHNGGTGEGGDGSDDFTWYAGKDATFPKGDYKEFKLEWDNTDVDDDNVRFFFHAGGLGMNFGLCWASVWESPLEEPSKCRLTQLGFYQDGSFRISRSEMGAGIFIADIRRGTTAYRKKFVVR